MVKSWMRTFRHHQRRNDGLADCECQVCVSQPVDFSWLVVDRLVSFADFGHSLFRNACNL